MKQKIIIATVLLFTFGASLYAAENTSIVQRETSQIDLTMTASTGNLFLAPRFYVNGVRYNFDEIQRVFDVTDELTKKLFYQAKKVWRTTFKNGFESENELVQKTIASFNRYIAEQAENRAKVLDVLEKMRREKEQERETRTRERNAYFEKRKNVFIGGKFVLGYQFQSSVGNYPGWNSSNEITRELNMYWCPGFRYARYYGDGDIAQGFIFELVFGGLIANKFFGGLNLMYGLKTGLCYMGFGGFFYVSESRFPYSNVVSFDSGLMMVIGLELRGLGKTKFFIGLELKGTPFALVKRLPGSDRIRYLSIALEMGVGY